MKITIPERQASPTTSTGQIYSLGGERLTESQIPLKTGVAQSAKIVSDTVLNLGERFQNAYDFKQNVGAKSAMTQNVTRMGEDLAADPKFLDVSADDYEAEYNKRFDEISGEVGKTIDSPGSRKFFNGLSGDMKIKGGIGARATGRKRVLDGTRAEVTRSLEVLSNAYMTDGDPEHFEDINGVINGAVASGAMSQKEGTVLVNSTTQNAVIGNMEERIRVDADQALTDLKDNRDFYVKGDNPLMAVNKYNDLKAKAKAVSEITSNAMKSETREAMKDSLMSVVTTGQEVPGVKIDIEKNLGKDALVKYGIDVKNSQMKYSAGETIKSVSGKDLNATINGMKPKAGTPGYSGKYEQWAHAVNVASMREKALKSDPVQYVFENSPGLDTVEKRKAEQLRLGVPEYAVSILSNQQSGKIVSDIQRSNNAGEITGMLTNLEAEYGEDYPVIMKDLVKNGMSDQMQLIGTLNRVEDLGTRDVMFNAIKTGRKELLSLQGEDAPANKQAVNGDLDDLLVEFNNSIFSGGMSPSRTGQADNIRSTLEITAYGYILKGIEPETAVKDAYDAVIGDRYSFVEKNDNYYRIPAKYDKKVIKSYLNDYVDELDMTDIRSPGTTRKTSPKNQGAMYKKTIKNDGYWSTNENETGVILFDAMGQPVMTNNGVRVETYFNSAVLPDPEKGMQTRSPRRPLPTNVTLKRTGT